MPSCPTTAAKEEPAIELLKGITPAQLKIIEDLLNKLNPR